MLFDKQSRKTNTSSAFTGTNASDKREKISTIISEKENE